MEVSFIVSQLIIKGYSVPLREMIRIIFSKGMYSPLAMGMKFDIMIISISSKKLIKNF